MVAGFLGKCIGISRGLGYQVSEDVVAKLMQEMGLKATTKRFAPLPTKLFARPDIRPSLNHIPMLV